MAVVPNPAACQLCGAGGGGGDSADVESLLLCDTMPDGTIVGSAIAVYEYDADGNPVGAPTFVIPGTNTPYVVVGTLQPCDSEGQSAVVELCDVNPVDATSVQFIRHYIFGPAGTVLSFHDSLADGSPYVPTGTVGDCDPYRLCTPDSSQDLNGDCGPGESPNGILIEAQGVAPDSVIADDPTADPLCGGIWARPAEPSPFNITESFRNATFDQPGPVIQGTAPYAGLTANPAFTGSNAGDPAGQGWIQMSDQNSATNGIWQVPAPFSTSDGLTASVTFASTDGAGGQNGDGLAFTFTDGSLPPETGAIGGGGGLGIPNWDGGYIAVVLDEYGGSGNVFAANTIKLIPAGPPGTAFNNNTVLPGGLLTLAPKAINLNNTITRTNPGRLIVSIINDGAATLLSASVQWDGDPEPTVYFNRFDLTAAGMPQAPATMRMSLYGGSGGAFRSEHEFRDAVATAAGLQEWRAFPITTDPIPACVTTVTVEVCVDQTFTDTTATVGDALPEAFLWLVNTATNTVIDTAQRSSIPSQVGTVANLCVNATVPVADLPNLRFYVGAETRDSLGDYGSLWENLTVAVGGLGCPVTPIRTLAISAPCPIDVNIVGGTADGTPAPVTVVNTPSTFEDAPVCITIGGVSTTGFRREVRAADGSVNITFTGATGSTVTPDSWNPGPCLNVDVELLELCDNTAPGVFVPFIRQINYTEGGTVGTSQDLDYNGLPYVPTGTVGRCPDTIVSVEVDQTLGPVCFVTAALPGITQQGFITLDELDNPVLYSTTGALVPAYTIVVCPETAIMAKVLCDAGNADHQFLRSYIFSPIAAGSGTLFDTELDGTTPYVPVGPVGLCAGSTRDSEAVLLCDDNGSFLRKFVYDGEDATFVGILSTTLDGNTPYVPVGVVKVCDSGCPTTYELIARCDYIGVPGALGFTTFFERLAWDCDGNLTGTDTITGAGLPYVPTGTVQNGVCQPDIEQEILCDSTGATFLRRYVWANRQVGVSPMPLIRFNDFALDGVTAFVPVGAVGSCASVLAEFDVETQVLCDANNARFLRRYVYDAETPGVPTVVNTLLDGTTAFAPVGVVGVCGPTFPADFDVAEEVLCDNNGGFIRRFTFNSVTGVLVSTTNLTLAGVAYVPVGTIGSCDGCCPIEVGRGCTNVGSLRYTALRLPSGVISLIDSVTGAAVLPANVVACTDDDTVRTLSAQARQVTNATPWTPGGDVIGTLTSISVTGTGGLWDMVDQNGTVLTGLPAGLTLTWSTLDDNTLLGPTSVTPQLGASVVANWTQR